MNDYPEGIVLKYVKKKHSIPGLSFRGFMGETDYPRMLQVLLASAPVDGIERSDTLEDITNQYAHLFHCDPYQDMLFAEVDGNLVAYTRLFWMLDASMQWIGYSVCFVLPEWRRKGIGTALLNFDEDRLSQVASQIKQSGEIPADTTCQMEHNLKETEVGRINLLEENGYEAVHFRFEMLRPNLEDIPDLPFPAGLEARALEQSHLPLILAATNEAFCDSWGFTPRPWEDFERYVNSPDFDPGLWSIAWEGEQVAGMVLSFIFKEVNKTFKRKRGFIENICVRGPWRRRGLAKALIAYNLMALKQRGMDEAALAVDSENKTGALHLYENMGFHAISRYYTYRKPIRV